MTEKTFWYMVKEYNKLMKEAIEGPNCIDPGVCKGDCCSIKIDVPKILAIEYIKRGYATKKDFIRGDVFTFHLRFDEKTGKCFLFDKSINGCSVHNSGIKPPQCWIYPTNFSNPDNLEIKCKKVGGWKIINHEKAKEAEELLQKFILLCEIEAKNELNKIIERIQKTPAIEILGQIAPSNLGGLKDAWDHFKVLSAEGISLQMKDFCFRFNKECEFNPDDFLECKNICDTVAEGLILYFKQNICEYIKSEGLSSDGGSYPLLKIFNWKRKN